MTHSVYFFINNDLLSDKNWKKTGSRAITLKRETIFTWKSWIFEKQCPEFRKIKGVLALGGIFSEIHACVLPWHNYNEFLDRGNKPLKSQPSLGLKQAVAMTIMMLNLLSFPIISMGREYHGPSATTMTFSKIYSKAKKN